MIRLFGGPGRFAWRDNRWASAVLHDGGRALAWVVVAVLIGAAFRAPASGAPGRRERLDWLGIMLLCSLAIPAVKRFSATSCPWDLAEFGGVARYVSHWQLGVPDGGAGHCFPSGHAVTAFAFLGLYFMWRGHNLPRARAWLATVAVVGLLFGAAQLARGAHYPSHTLWSAWLCWALCVAADALFRWPASKPL